MKRRWRAPVEVVWWIETLFVCALIPTPGIAGGLVLVPFFVPVLVSHVRHGRTLGPVGYWYSVVVISLEVAVVVLTPLSGSMRSSRDWLIWIAGLLVALLVGASAWCPTSRERLLASDRTEEKL